MIVQKAVLSFDNRAFYAILVGEGGFEPPKPKQQIYSLPHLTALELSRI